jgi:biofilm PGA synthesis N-glycosyltransferase PgaC
LTILSIVLYIYLGYPLLLYVKSIIFPKHPLLTCDMVDYPRVSVVIAARNEEKNIESRIYDIINQDYPKERLEIVIVSDGSSDATEDIARHIITETQLREKGFLKIHSHKPSLGKPSCLNRGVGFATGDIIIFTDCRQRFAVDAIKELARSFVDPKVGCVSGELIFEEVTGSSIQAEMGAYWNFEKWVRRLESKTGSVPGATGAIYAIRKILFDPLPEQTLLDDVLTPLRISIKGFRTIFNSKAIAYDTVSQDLQMEKKRKIRTLAGNWQLLFLEPKILNPFKNPVWLRFLSHKILRLLVPYFLIWLFIISLFSSGKIFIFFISFMFILFFIYFLPTPTVRFTYLSKIKHLFSAVLMLNYFAFLAPFKLIFGSKKLW